MDIIHNMRRHQTETSDDSDEHVSSISALSIKKESNNEMTPGDENESGVSSLRRSARKGVNYRALALGISPERYECRKQAHAGKTSQAPSQDTSSEDEDVPTTTGENSGLEIRKRGRPRKIPTPVSSTPVERRPRGRPPKILKFASEMGLTPTIKLPDTKTPTEKQSVKKTNEKAQNKIPIETLPKRKTRQKVTPPSSPSSEDTDSEPESPPRKKKNVPVGGKCTSEDQKSPHVSKPKGKKKPLKWDEESTSRAVELILPTSLLTMCSNVEGQRTFIFRGKYDGSGRGKLCIEKDEDWTKLRIEDVGCEVKLNSDVMRCEVPSKYSWGLLCPSNMNARKSSTQTPISGSVFEESVVRDFLRLQDLQKVLDQKGEKEVSTVVSNSLLGNPVTNLFKPKPKQGRALKIKREPTSESDVEENIQMPLSQENDDSVVSVTIVKRGMGRTSNKVKINNLSSDEENDFGVYDDDIDPDWKADKFSPKKNKATSFITEYNNRQVVRKRGRPPKTPIVAPFMLPSTNFVYDDMDGNQTQGDGRIDGNSFFGICEGGDVVSQNSTKIKKEVDVPLTMNKQPQKLQETTAVLATNEKGEVVLVATGETGEEETVGGEGQDVYLLNGKGVMGTEDSHEGTTVILDNENAGDELQVLALPGTIPSEQVPGNDHMYADEADVPLNPITDKLLRRRPERGLDHMCVVCGNHYSNFLNAKRHVSNDHTIAWIDYLELFQMPFDQAKERVEDYRRLSENCVDIKDQLGRRMYKCEVCLREFHVSHIIGHLKEMHARHPNMKTLIKNQIRTRESIREQQFRMEHIVQGTVQIEYSEELREGDDTVLEFICVVCNEKFFFYESVILHFRMHSMKWRDFQKAIGDSTTDGEVQAILQKVSKGDAEKKEKVVVKPKKQQKQMFHRCPICRKTGMGARSVLSHVAMAHKSYKGVNGILLQLDDDIAEHRITYGLQGNPVICQFCHRVRHGAAAVGRHLKFCHSDEPKFAEAIGKAQKTLLDMKKARKRKTAQVYNEKLKTEGPKSFKCPYCEKNYANRASRDMHINSFCVVNPYGGKSSERLMCGECGHTCPATRPQKMVRHTQRVHGPDSRVHHCDLCSRTFNTKQGVVMHKKRRHDGMGRGAAPDSDTEVSTEVPGVQCPVCDKYFKNLQYLNAHIVVKHDQIEPDDDALPEGMKGKNIILLPAKQNAQCDMCERSFTSSLSLQKHRESVHFGKFLFNCDKCNFKTNRINYFNTHKCKTDEPELEMEQVEYEIASPVAEVMHEPEEFPVAEEVEEIPVPSGNEELIVPETGHDEGLAEQVEVSGLEELVQTEVETFNNYKTVVVNEDGRVVNYIQMEEGGPYFEIVTTTSDVT